MKGFDRFLKGFLFLLLAGFLTGAATLPLSAQVTIPQGSVVNQAIFSVYAYYNWTGVTVNLYRITKDWGETSVTWNNFQPGFDLNAVGSFTPISQTGWQSVDLTVLVQGWVNGTYPNYGIVIKHDVTNHWNLYHSSEALDVSIRPKLEIWYTTPAGVPGYTMIQRPDLAQNDVADASIYQNYPNENYNSALLTVAVSAASYWKYSLIRFNLVMSPPSEGPGTGTPGYWKNHPNAWPVGSITIGGISYTKATAIALMSMDISGDKTYTMFKALVAAILNGLIGNDDSCISATISAAQDWMAANPVGSGVTADTIAWKIGEPLYMLLDAYNNGLLCAPPRH